MKQDNNLIVMKDINKRYQMGDNEVIALENVSLAVGVGEFVAILGPSGSGKSTLMNIMGCIDATDSGEYLLAGENVADLDDDQLALIRNREVGFIFQQFNLLPRYKAIQNVELPLLLRGVPREQARERAEQVMDQVGLKDRADHKPSELSGGQQQRVAIARALVGNPSILLADEPTGNLDTRSGQEIMGMMKEVNRQGHTVILITHDLEVARMAKRVIRMIDGKISMEESYELSAAGSGR
ncbi:cell division transporter, atp-binding protein ftse [hydrocarbon metagenome]|uniref:Cell division transporter, atp-binding protein ftse n=1 Tax=hydrocarbon metagenome TaxID=938273 RepID=A0A0W8E1P9_9ZZZZ